MKDYQNFQFIGFMHSSTESVAIDEFLKLLNQQYVYDSILKEHLYEEQSLSNHEILKQIIADKVFLEKKNNELTKELCKVQNELSNLKHKSSLSSSIRQDNKEIAENKKTDNTDPEDLEDLEDLSLDLNLDELLEFFPAIYKNFWSAVSPKELAHSLGLKTVPIIASPYIPPTRSSIKKTKRRFKNLNPSKRQKIIFLCQILRRNHNLVIHRDFSRLIDEEY